MSIVTRGHMRLGASARLAGARGARRVYPSRMSGAAEDSRRVRRRRSWRCAARCSPPRRRCRRPPPPRPGPAAPIPAKYDLRAHGRVTRVGLQNHYGTCWIFAAIGSLESCLLPGLPARPLREPHGGLPGLAPALRGARPEHHLDRLRRALGGPRAGARRPVSASGALAGGPARRASRAGGPVPAAARQPARERRDQVGGDALRRRGRDHGLRAERLQRRHQRVLLARHGPRPPRLRRRLGRRVSGRAVPAPAARPRRVPHQEQLGHELRAGRLLLDLLLRPLVRDDAHGVRRRRGRRRTTTPSTSTTRSAGRAASASGARRRGSPPGTRAAATAASPPRASTRPSPARPTRSASRRRSPRSRRRRSPAPARSTSAGITPCP